MPDRSSILCLTDIVETIGHVRSEMRAVPLEAFEGDWRRRWVVECGVEIIAEASRRLPDTVRARHPDIPWLEVAGIGDVLRDYENAAPQVMWAWVRHDLPPLEKACWAELEAALTPEREGEGTDE